MTSPRRTLALAAIAAVAALGACDIPTAAPIWDTTWQVPVNDDSIEVDQVLPGGITSTGVVFQVAVQSDSVSSSLGEMCGAPCAAVHGMNTAIPPFTVILFVEDSFPANVLQITPGPGQSYAYEIRNDLTFDPLRPAGGVFGMIIVGMVDPDSNIVAVDTVLGEDVALPVGTTLARTMPLGTAPVGGPFQLAARVEVPTGGTAVIDTAGRITVTTTQDSVGIAAARVVIDSVAISSFSRELDLSDLADDVTSIVQSARVRVQIQNPMAIAGAVLLEFQDGVGTDLIPAKPFALAGGASTQEVGLSLAEIVTLLDYGIVTMRVTGVVTGTLGSNAADVHPNDVAQLSSRVFLELRVNGED